MERFIYDDTTELQQSWVLDNFPMVPDSTPHVYW